RVLHLNVETLIIPVDQFLYRSRQVLVGGDDRHELADVQTSADRENAAAQVKDEGRELRQEVVDELHHELPLVEVEPDEEDLRQTVRYVGALEVRVVVQANVDGPIDDLADPARQVTRRQLALQCQIAQTRPQLGN